MMFRNLLCVAYAVFKRCFRAREFSVAWPFRPARGWGKVVCGPGGGDEAARLVFSDATFRIRSLEKARQQLFGCRRTQKVCTDPAICSYSTVVRIGELAPYFAATSCCTVAGIRSALPRKNFSLWNIIVRCIVSQHIPRRFVWPTS